MKSESVFLEMSDRLFRCLCCSSGVAMATLPIKITLATYLVIRTNCNNCFIVKKENCMESLMFMSIDELQHLGDFSQS